MHINEIQQAMDGQSVTNGWDAVLALNATQLTSILFQQYLQEGPTHQALPLRAILIEDAPDFWILDLCLGPPEISFNGDLSSQQCQVTMFLVKGFLVNFYSDGQRLFIKSALPIKPNESWLTGKVNLAQISGTGNQVGELKLDLASGAYEPIVSGIDPASTLATQLGIAVQTFFANNAVSYTLGKIGLSNVPPCLQPTFFDFITQTPPDGKDGDGCVVVLIQTNGTPGTVEPITPYPISAGDTAALLVSSQVVFNQLMPGKLTQAFQNTGTTFSGQQSDGMWQVYGSGGSLNLGVLGENSGHSPYSSDSSQNVQPVVVSTDGFTVAPSRGNLFSSWNKTWDQYWTYWYSVPDPNGGSIWDSTAQNTPLEGGYSLTSVPTVDPSTDIVRFSDGGTANLKLSDPPGWFMQYVEGQYEVEGQFKDTMQTSLQQIFSGLEIPDVNTFALSNILFPSRHDALSLTQATVPCDLLVTGQVASSLKLSPASVNLKPGHQVQFTAILNGQPTFAVSWEASAGSIDKNGLYTAPPEIDEPQVVVITAVDNMNLDISALAMALVFNPPVATHLLINPSEVLLTQNHPFTLQVTDDQGNPIDANCLIDPNVGMIALGFSTGSWIYFPPETLQEASTVTVTAVSNSDSSKTGSATIQLATIEPVTIAPASVNLTANQSVTLKASPADLDEFVWVIYPTGSGSIKRSNDDHTMATYSAPDSINASMQVRIAAYSLNEAAGIGLAQINLAPA